MNTYAIIETNSGFVWGVEVASDPTIACELMDRNNGLGQHRYEEGDTQDLRTTRGAYDVRLAPDGFNVYDGQDPVSIAAVENMPRAAVVVVEADD